MPTSSRILRRQQRAIWWGSRGGLYRSLVAAHKLGEASGVRADSMPAGPNYGGHALTDNNTVANADGKVGKAAFFARANSESLSRADADLGLLSPGSHDCTG